MTTDDGRVYVMYTTTSISQLNPSVSPASVSHLTLLVSWHTHNTIVSDFTSQTAAPSGKYVKLLLPIFLFIKVHRSPGSSSARTCGKRPSRRNGCARPRRGAGTAEGDGQGA